MLTIYSDNYLQYLIFNSTDIIFLSFICVYHSLVSTELLATTKSRAMNEAILSKWQFGYAKINLEVLLPTHIS